MRILLLTLYFGPDIGANAAILTALSEELVALGHQVTVVTSVPHYATNVVDQRYRGRIVHQEQYKGMRVIRTFVYSSPKKRSIAVRLLNYVSFNLLSTVAGVLAGRQDVILAPSPPLTIGLSAFVIGLVKGVPYVYNVRDIYPDVAIKLGALKNRWIIAFSRWLERFVYSHAARVVVLSEGFRTNLLGKGVPRGKLAIIPDFADVEFVRPLPRDNGFRQRMGLEDRFVVLYAGNIGYSQNLEHFLECAAMLRDEPEILFLIVGNGSRKPYLEGLAREMELDNVRFLPFQPLEDVPEMYASADAGLITLRRGISQDSVPSKAYTIMAGGRPILAAVDRGSETWTLVEQVDCGLCVEPENPVALSGAVRALHSDPDRGRRMGQKGRQHVLNHYTPRAVARQFHDLLSAIVNHGHGEQVPGTAGGGGLS